MSFLSLRKLFPAALDTLSYSCTSRVLAVKNIPVSADVPHRGYSNSATNEVDAPRSENDVVSPLFMTRNPRNLERMAIANKPKGWSFQYPPRLFYHRLRFEKTKRFVTGWVEHNSGRSIVTASSKEFAIAKHLYSLNDVSAAQNIGRILGRRCLEAGIDCMDVLEPETGENSEKAFRDALVEAGVELAEPAEIEPEYDPGINYDDEWEVENLAKRQARVSKQISRTVFKFGLIRHRVKVKKYKD